MPYGNAISSCSRSFANGACSSKNSPNSSIRPWIDLARSSLSVTDGNWRRGQYVCVARIRSVMNGATVFRINPPSSNQQRGRHRLISRIRASAQSFVSVRRRQTSRTHSRSFTSIPKTMCTVKSRPACFDVA